jgi:hypothetical protein
VPTNPLQGRRSRRPASPDLPGLEEVIVLGLAAARLARAISVDEISEPARARLTRTARATPARAWSTWADRLVGCPLCVGWWTSLAVSLAAPGRHRLLRGMAVAGAQVVLALSERLISEEGRMAIHTADIAAAADPVARDVRDGDDGQNSDGTSSANQPDRASILDLAPHDG